MGDWDKPDNFTNTIGYLTLYTAQYTDELSDFSTKFDWDHMSSVMGDLKEYFNDMIDNFSDAGATEELDLVGLNSNSFKADPTKHNLFLEWDEEYYIPPEHVLEQFNGLITKTNRGFHLIREDNLTIDELISHQIRWNCCSGFVSFCKKRKYAVLRVSPKEKTNRLRILKNQEGFLYSVYTELVEGLDKEV